MTDDELEAIRERKREQLERQVAGGDGPDGAVAPDEPVHVDGRSHLDELVDRYDVVLADFHADWCGPCQMLDPVVTQLAAETDAAVAKVDVDAHQALAAQYGVRGVPTLVLFAGGEVSERLTGVQDEGRLVSLIERYA